MYKQTHTPFVAITKNTDAISQSTKRIIKATDYFLSYFQGTSLVQCFQIKVGSTTISVIAKTDNTSNAVDRPNIPNI